ncbi:glycosyltransferase, partial [Endozoicomonas sp. SESOKO3]|uniref:glycosyltransferase n=1 Tax=Endozoicomonas sp. SESOKO3 TaxID=2828744 RepID=UPI00359F2F1C
MIQSHQINIFDDEWFQHRFMLFEAFTLPSLMNQSNQNFIWCIFIGSNMPLHQKDKLKSLTSSFKNIRLIPTNTSWSSEKIEEIFRSEYPEKKFIITSRIDDDDLWKHNYIESVQSEILSKKDNKLLLTHPLGYEYVIDEVFSDNRYYEKQLTKYPISCLGTSVNVLSTIDNLTTCLDASHSQIKSFAEENNINYIEITPEVPMWIYIRHKQADSSIKKSKDFDLIDDKVIKEGFGINWLLLEAYLKEVKKFKNAKKRIMNDNLKGVNTNTADSKSSALIQECNITLLGRNILDFSKIWEAHSGSIKLDQATCHDAKLIINSKEKKAYLISSDKVGKAIPKNLEKYLTKDFPRKIRLKFKCKQTKTASSLHLNQFNNISLIDSKSLQIRNGINFIDIDLNEEAISYKWVLSSIGEGSIEL